MSRFSLITLAGCVALAIGSWLALADGKHGGDDLAARPTLISRPYDSLAPVSHAVEADSGTGHILRVPMRSEFETAPDLFVFAQQVSLRAHAGDADAQWLLSRVYDYCAGYASDPGAYASDTRAISALDVSTAPVMAAARERMGRRCARFTPADGLNREVIQETRLRAALAGSLPAEAAMLAEGMPMSDAIGYRRELVERVMASGDPQAFLALSSAMGLAASGEESELGEVSGTWLSELAWQVAACRLGMDCRAESNLMTVYCANGGICSRDPRQDFASFVLDGGVPRQGADHLNTMVGRLLSRRRLLK